MLPWLENDTLPPQEKQAVLEHAHACVICRRELSKFRQLYDSISRASSAMPIPEPNMRNINARIDALIDRQNWGRGLMSRLRSVFDSPWRIAFVAQSVALVVLATVLLWPEPESAEYTTLTQTENLPNGRYVRVVFSPDFDQSQLAVLLDKFDLTVVDGPSNRGVYTVAIGNSTEIGDAMVSRLQDDPGILFAQPVNVGVGQ